MSYGKRARRGIVEAALLGVLPLLLAILALAGVAKPSVRPLCRAAPAEADHRITEAAPGHSVGRTWLTMTRTVTLPPAAMASDQPIPLLQWFSQDAAADRQAKPVLWTLAWGKQPHGWLGDVWALVVICRCPTSAGAADQHSRGSNLDHHSTQKRSDSAGWPPDGAGQHSIVLSYAQPQPGHTYEGAVSLSTATGTAAVQLLDGATRDVIYSGIVDLSAVSAVSAVLPTTAARVDPVLPAKTACPVIYPADPATTDMRPVGVPFGLRWAVRQNGFLCGDAELGSLSSRRVDAADRRRPVELKWQFADQLQLPSFPGELSLRLVTADRTVTLISLPYAPAGTAPVQLGPALPAGGYAVELWFTDASGQEWRLGRDVCTFGTIDQTVYGWHLGTDHGRPSLQGVLVLSPDGPFDVIRANLELAPSRVELEWMKPSRPIEVPFSFPVDIVPGKELRVAIKVSLASAPQVHVNEEEHAIMVSVSRSPVYSVSDDGDVVVHPVPYQGAFRNPLKGIRSLGLPITDPLSSLTKMYIPWNKLENEASDGANKIVDYSQSAWGMLPHDVKVIPRVFLQWGPNGEENYWPADMNPGDYSSPQFVSRLLGLIAKLGQAWDHDPHVAYVEMGLIGWWGEQHHPNVSPALQQLMGEAFVKAFPDKKIMRRRADDFQAWPFGIYWDSFAHPNELWHVPLIEKLGPNWAIAPRGGEMAFDWGTPLGNSATDALLNHLPAIEGWVRRLHWNHLGFWPASYDASDPAAVNAAEQLQKVLGYRFVITEARYPQRVSRETAATVRMVVENTGASPFYYDWPLELYLLDGTDHHVVWNEIWPGVDIRSWLPSNRADIGASSYAIEAAFRLPSTLPPGQYELAVGIVDPGWDEPAVRFAVANHYSSNLCPLGMIAVDAPAGDPAVMTFDDLATGLPHLIAEPTEATARRTRGVSSISSS